MGKTEELENGIIMKVAFEVKVDPPGTADNEHLSEMDWQRLGRHEQSRVMKRCEIDVQVKGSCSSTRLSDETSPSFLNSNFLSCPLQSSCEADKWE